MGGAGEREFLIGESKTIGSARFHERERLQRLHRRARKDRPFHIAEAEHETPAGIDQRDRAAVAALDQGAAQDFDQNGIAHDVRSGN